MTDWIEHNGGPQPVADDVWVERKDGHYETECAPAGAFEWVGEEFKFHILNQHLIDAALKRGIRLGLEAANKAVEALVSAGDLPIEEESALEDATLAIRDINPDTIAREAVLDQLTREAQAQGMGYDTSAGPPA